MKLKICNIKFFLIALEYDSNEKYLEAEAGIIFINTTLSHIITLYYDTL